MCKWNFLLNGKDDTDNKKLWKTVIKPLFSDKIKSNEIKLNYTRWQNLYPIDQSNWGTKFSCFKCCKKLENCWI